MTKDPAVLFYTSDFLSGTSFFSYEEKGQYITLLCQQHQSWEIPENHMINICGSLESIVVKKFIRTDTGFYYNERMRNEAERRRNFCDSRSNNKSGRPKKKIIRESYDSKMNIHMETETETENITINKRFRKPTLIQVSEYCAERKSSVDPKKFFDNYESSGWIKANGQKVKDWKATVRTWENKEINTKKSSWNTEDGKL